VSTWAHLLVRLLINLCQQQSVRVCIWLSVAVATLLTLCSSNITAIWLQLLSCDWLSECEAMTVGSFTRRQHPVVGHGVRFDVPGITHFLLCHSQINITICRDTRPNSLITETNKARKKYKDYGTFLFVCHGGKVPVDKQCHPQHPCHGLTTFTRWHHCCDDCLSTLVSSFCPVWHPLINVC